MYLLTLRFSQMYVYFNFITEYQYCCHLFSLAPFGKPHLSGLDQNNLPDIETIQLSLDYQAELVWLPGFLTPATRKNTTTNTWEEEKPDTRSPGDGAAG